MITDYPLRSSPVPAISGQRPPPQILPPAVKVEAFHYDGGGGSRTAMVVAVLISAGLHLFVIFGIRSGAGRSAAPAEKENLIQFTVTPLKPDDLDEVEVAPRDDNAPKDVAVPVPMQADVLRTVQPEDFVQKVDLTSLLQQPDLSQAKVLSIPEHFTRAGNIAGNIGQIFNIAELDRVPEPIVQQAPVYPPSLKREGLQATVRVEFIVDTKGLVLDAFVVDSTHPGFNEAAVSGVSRWKFRPGQKMGRKVNTRMQVPIIFKVTDGLD